MRTRVGVILAVLATALAVGACGGGESGGSKTLNFYIFNEPGGGPQDVAKKCSDESGGKYNIEFQLLPNTADQQREQLVRRLGAEDKTIDMIGMDVIWTGEFATAGWIEPVPEDVQGPATSMVFQSAIETGKAQGKLYAVPIWSNTQLLWYRKDKSPQPPKTWDEMIDKAVEQKTTIAVQAKRYEGLVVWTNAMIESAGTTILDGEDKVALEKGPTEKAIATMGKLGASSAGGPALDTSEEDPARMAFEAGDAFYQVNYPFVYASAKDGAPKIFKQMGAAKYPQVVPGQESKPPLGGINLAVSSYSRKKDLAWEAIRCMIKAENQITIMEKGGLPPVREDLYDQPEVKKAYPGFASTIRDSIRDAAPRPAASPAYQDISLAIQDAIHPVSKINERGVGTVYEKLRENVEKGIKREGLLG